MKRQYASVFGLLLAVLALHALPTRAAAITVINTNDSGPGSLRQAIVDASPGDTINFNLTYPATIVLTSGELTINKDLTISGPGASNLTIRRNAPEGDLFDIEYGVAVAISGVTLGPCDTGIYNRGTLTVTNSIFSGMDYAGIFNSSATVNVTNCTFSNNDDYCLYNSNSSAAMLVTNSTFSDNSGSINCLYNSSGALTITNSTLSNNTGSSSGTGIYNSSGTLVVTGSTFSGNRGWSGTGIYNYNGPLSVTNSTFYSNTAEFDGGGIYNSSGTLTVTNSTFYSNTAGSEGGGIYNGVATPATLKNTIIANSGGGGNCYGSFQLASTNNLSTDSSCSPGFTQVTSVQLALGALTGSPAYFPLNPGSAAIDTGTNTGCPATDQRGVSRPQDGDGNGSAVCDIGSYEFVLYKKVYLPLVVK